MSASLLQQRIMARIRQQGPISFADYMRMALYEPDYGYYVSGPARIGWEGDFYTSTDVANLFAHCIGRQLQYMWEALGQPTSFGVLEQGAGRGDLADGVRKWAVREASTFYQALDYRAEDIHAGQDALVSPVRDRTAEADDVDRAAEGSQKAPLFVPSVILSNELVDAFPVHIVQKRGERLYEVYVDVQNDLLVEILGEPCNLEVEGYLDVYKVPWRTYEDDWRAEINLDALRWMRQTAQRLVGPDSRHKRHGFILTVDYGDTARKLYIRERHYGTLACYYKHQLTERPLVKPGEQDLTAHVNFTALIEEARKQGLHPQTLTTQREWLTAMGIYEEMESLYKRDFALAESDRATDQGQVALLQWYNLRQRASLLTEPGGMGNFKVLILKR